MDNTKIDELFVQLNNELQPDPTHDVKRDRNPNNIHLVRNSLLAYLIEEFPYGNDWVHPVTYQSYKCTAIKATLHILQELNPERYRILWALWTTRKDSLYLADRFYCSVQTIKRQWERALDSLVLLLFFSDLTADITNVTKLI